jgi:hypothetical protein
MEVKPLPRIVESVKRENPHQMLEVLPLSLMSHSISEK